MAQKTYVLTPLTGVHVGTGEELTPLDYKIASKVGTIDFKKLTYWKFSSDRILQRLMNDEKALEAFHRANAAGNMGELQRFFQANCTMVKDTDYPCEITEGFLKTYKANLSKGPYENEAKVLQMYHAPGSPRPVIPGSSLKGSIRTALLNMYLDGLPEVEYKEQHDRFKQERQPGKFNNPLQQKLLHCDDARNDPFRAVSVSDSPFSANRTQLVGTLNMMPKQTGSLEASGPPIQAEILKGTLLGGEAVSEVCISINEALQKINYVKAISFEDIQKGCNHFYWDEFCTEYDTFYKNIYDGSEALITGLKNELEKAVMPGSKKCIVRVGRWSQVEFVTFEENFRRPETRIGRHGTTRTLFDYNGKYVPMGWCVLSEKGGQ